MTSGSRPYSTFTSVHQMGKESKPYHSSGPETASLPASPREVLQTTVGLPPTAPPLLQWIWPSRELKTQLLEADSPPSPSDSKGQTRMSFLSSSRLNMQSPYQFSGSKGEVKDRSPSHIPCSEFSHTGTTSCKGVWEMEYLLQASTCPAKNQRFY